MSNSAASGSQRRVDLLSEIVGINSVNPGQTGERSGAGGEAEMANWIAERSADLGASVVLDDVEPGRPNVYARFPGRTDRVVAIDVHLDTVGVEHMEGDPFDGRVADGRVYGRGSVDTKATFAVVLPILEDAASGNFDLDPTILLVGTVGEEMGGLPGAYRFQEWLGESGERLNQLVVAEPTVCAPVHGHKGGLGMEITVHGHAAHSSKPELGANAITAAARVIVAIQAEHERLLAGEASTAMGTGTLSVTEIQGGRARNIIPDICQLYAGRRIAPGEDPYQIFAELSEVINQAADPLEATIEMMNGRASSAFYEEPDSELIQRLATIAESSPEVATYGTNALAYNDIADQVVVFGPGSIDQAHQAVEWVDINELDRADHVYRSWLSGAQSGS
jgi:acetylornithine deacetylase/succinyl-diaminopimelate desuccinylase-like protein